MLLREIFEPALYESGHLFAPDFESLMISEKDLKNIAKLALRDINKYSHQEKIKNIEMCEGQWIVPVEMKGVRSVSPQYQSGYGFNYDAKARLFTGPKNCGIAVCISSDWEVTEVVLEDGQNLTSNQPETHSYLDSHSLPAQPQNVWEIVGWENCTIHREDLDKLMSAHFMIVVGRSRENFLLNESSASPNGQSLYDQGKELRDATFEALIESSDQFLGILDSPEFM